MKDDGSGKLANGNISWDTEGSLTLKYGTRKEFKTIDIDDYDFANAFEVDLKDGLNFFFFRFPLCLFFLLFSFLLRFLLLEQSFLF